MLTITAPAKINLTLEVLGKRPDGYHEVRSILQAVSLCDVLHFTSGEGTKIISDNTVWSAEKSLVPRAVDLLKEATRCDRGATISIEKNVPLTGGLGGDSSDAAATLKGLDSLWETGLSGERLLALAAQLGSDVPFFLYGGTALAEGRGENVTRLPSLPHHCILLVMPDVPITENKTAGLYARLHKNHYTDGQITGEAVEEIRNGRVPSHLFNTFENIAFGKGSKAATYRSHLRKMGAKEVHLAGSGPALFILVKDKAEAEDLYQRCRGQGMETYLAETL